MFYYIDGEDATTFQDPSFPVVTELVWDSPILQATAEAACGEDMKCLFDYSVTKDETLATNTLITNNENNLAQEEVRKFVYHKLVFSAPEPYNMIVS